MLLVKHFLEDQKVLRSDDSPRSPLVSVILPTYARHASGRLARAVESVLSQNFDDFELIVVDDGSTDGTHDFVERLRAEDPRVVHVRHERNSGLPALRANEGIELARGRFIAFQFDDDSWRPGALAALVGGAERHDGTAVIVGRCRARGPRGQQDYPDREVELPYLYERNLIANNSVLVPRRLAERHGMLDCHVALRRNCDWDLWIRYARRVPFVVVDEVVSDVEVELPDSIGRTTPYDFTLVRFFHSARRDHLLTPARWREYEVDALRAGEDEIEGEMRRRLYEEQVVPFYLRHRHHFPQVENFPASLPARRKSVLYTKEVYDDPLCEILMNHDEATSRRGSYKALYQPQSQVAPEWVRETDLLLLVRPFQQKAEALLAQALDAGRPVGYFLDDDFLTLHESGPEFDFLAPGAPARRRLANLLKDSDAVWVSSRAIKNSVGPLNARTVPYDGSIRRDELPRDIRPRDKSKPLRVGCTSGGYRQEELGYLWEALSRFSREHGDRVTFEFWGVDVSRLPPLASPVVCRPFAHSYTLYLERLRDAEFDLFLAPLLERPRARLAKAPNKYYLAAVAGALGVFSDVQPYEMLPGGLTCLKAENTVEGWYGALGEAARMDSAGFDLMRRRMLEHVREEFTEAAELNTHEAALRATEFHALTREKRHADGRPRVLLFCPAFSWKGDEDAFALCAGLLHDYGVRPVAVFHGGGDEAASPGLTDALARRGVEVEFLSPAGSFEDRESQLKSLLERHNAALVQSFSLFPTLGNVCREAGVPHVAAPVEALGGTLWEASFRYCDATMADTLRRAEQLRRMLDAERFCARGPVARELFDLGTRRHLEALGGAQASSTGTPQSSNVETLRVVAVGPFGEGSAHLKAVEALGHLSGRGLKCRLDLYADAAASPERAEGCRLAALSFGVADDFGLHEYAGDDTRIFRDADVLLCVPDGGDVPHAIKAAMACGVLVVTPAGEGVSELIIDGVSGIVCGDDSAEGLSRGVARAVLLGREGRRAIVGQARRVARFELHPRRAANDLFRAYNRALELARARQPAGPSDAGVVSRASKQAACSFGEEPPFPASNHVLLSKRLRFLLIPRREGWSGLDVLIGTHMRPAHGSLRLRVCSTEGEVLREEWEDLARVGDNEWVSFRFPAIADAARKTFVAEFGLDTRDPHTRVSIYENTPPEGRVRRLLRRADGWRANGRGVRHSLHCRMWYAG